MSNTLGVSGRHMLEAILAGHDDPQQLAQLAGGRLKEKIPQLKQAQQARVREHHRFLIAEYLDEWDALGDRMGRIEAKIDRRISPFESAVTLWQTLPGRYVRAITKAPTNGNPARPARVTSGCDAPFARPPGPALEPKIATCRPNSNA